MNKKNIFNLLSFTPIREDSLIISKLDIDKISKLFDNIFKTSGETEQVFITRTLEDEALAISTAEDSSISPTEAANIKVTDEQSLRIIKYQKSPLPTEKKYESLEYENIKSVSSQSTGIGFEHLNIEIICQLHHDLTLGLDEYTSELSISKYHSGKLRKNNTIKVGRFPPYEPPEYKEISPLLKNLFEHYRQKKNIHLIDIIEFGVLLYAIHPFQNGNKRITRIIESALLNFYGYSARRTISLGRAYSIEKPSFNFFLLDSLKDKNTTSFVNFTLRCYTKEGKLNMLEFIENEAEHKIKTRILPYSSNKKQKQYQTAFSCFQKSDFSLKNRQFTKSMEDAGFSHSIAQNILKTLVTENIVTKDSNGYCLSGFYQLVKLSDFIDLHIQK